MKTMRSILVLVVVLFLWIMSGLVAGRMYAGVLTYQYPYFNNWDVTILPAVLCGPAALLVELLKGTAWGWNVKLLSKEEAWVRYHKKWPDNERDEFDRSWGSPVEKGFDIHPIN